MFAIKFENDKTAAGLTFEGEVVDRRRLRSSCIQIVLNHDLLENCTRKELVEQLLVSK